MLSIGRFRAVLRSPRLGWLARWIRRQWNHYWAWWHRKDRWHVLLAAEWNAAHHIPVWPPWRWEWQVPWKTYRQPLPIPQHFALQLIVLRFDIQLIITKSDKLERPLSQLLVLAALVWLYLARCR